MLDLDRFQKTVEVKYKGKIYQLEKLKEKEKEIQNEINEAIQENDITIYDKIKDFIVDRFKRADGEFPAEDFENEVTLDMLIAIYGALTGAEMELKKNK